MLNILKKPLRQCLRQKRTVYEAAIAWTIDKVMSVAVTKAANLAYENKGWIRDKLATLGYIQPIKKLHDFEIRISDDLTEIGSSKGFPVHIDPNALNALSLEMRKDPGFMKSASSTLMGNETKDTKHFQRTALVGVMGYYSKGKSHIVNLLFNRGFNGASKLEVPSSPGVTTKGISGVFVRYENGQIGNAECLILDCAGRNAPARIPEKAFGDFKQHITLRDRVNAMRSKERLIDDVIIEVADLLVYVMDEVLNEDQQAFLHILDEITAKRALGRRQELILVHNFKLVDIRNDILRDKHIQEMVVKPFNATPASDSVKGTHWRSNWAREVDNSVYNIEVHHYVMFSEKEGVEGIKHNAEIVSKMYNKIAPLTVDLVRQDPPLEYISKTIIKGLDNYIHVEKDGSGSNTTTTTTTTSSKPSATDAETLFGYVHSDKFTGNVQLNPWDSWITPISSLQAYRPKYCTQYLDDSTVAYIFDVSGIAGPVSFKNNDLRKEIKENVSWVHLESINVNSGTYKLTGFRAPAVKYAEGTCTLPGDQCGLFEYSFTVPEKCREYKVGSAEVVNGVLSFQFKSKVSDI